MPNHLETYMKKIFPGSVLSGLLLAASSVANAGAPVALDSMQLDAVHAGLQRSSSVAAGRATTGFTASGSQTIAVVNGPVTSTSATSAAVAFGTGAGATASAGTTFR